MPNKRSITDDLLEQVNREPAVWDPEPGDTLAGVVVSRSTRSSDYGSYPVVEIDDGDEVVEFRAYRTVARREVERHDVGIGDVIAVKYLGEITGTDSTYHGYRIATDRDATAPAVEEPSEEPSEWAEAGHASEAG
jgi:hypothetical protein